MRAVGRFGSWLGWWVGLWGFYLLLASRVTWAEAVVGAAAAALAATGAVVTARAGDLQFRPRWRWLGLLTRLPGRVLLDCGVVGVALWDRIVRRREVAGTFRLVPFDVGGDDPVSCARRALVTAGVSLAPNTYVVDVDRRKGLLLVHQLVPTARQPGGGDAEWPL